MFTICICPNIKGTTQDKVYCLILCIILDIAFIAIPSGLI